MQAGYGEIHIMYIVVQRQVPLTMDITKSNFLFVFVDIYIYIFFSQAH